MNILKIYKKYKLPPQLQLHQLRVAAVAKQIIDNFTEKLSDKDEIITTCLLHDMGNIIKFNLDLYPQHLEPEGYDYWEGVQNDYIKKYGKDESKATLQIIHEIGVKNRVIDILSSIGFINNENNAAGKDYSIKICAYSDLRVKPEGISSLLDRINDGKKRYEINHKKKSEQEVFDRNTKAAIEIEKQIFKRCSIDREEINEKAIEPIIDKLKQYSINL